LGLEAKTLEERAHVLGGLALALRVSSAVVGGVDADQIARAAHDLRELVGRHGSTLPGRPCGTWNAPDPESRHVPLGAVIRPSFRSEVGHGSSQEAGDCCSGSKIWPTGSRFSAWKVSSARPAAQYAESESCS